MSVTLVYNFLIALTRKGTQMINSYLTQILVIDRPNFKMNNLEKIIGGDLLWRPTEAAKKNRFFNVSKTFSPKSCLWIKVAYANSFNF